MDEDVPFLGREAREGDFLFAFTGFFKKANNPPEVGGGLMNKSLFLG